MHSRKLRKIALDFYQKYQKEGLDISLNRLIKVVKISAQKAEDHFLKLKPPKTAPKEAYIAYWVREVLSKDLAKKTLISINNKNPPPEPYFQAIAAYFSLLPLELIRRINQEINNTPPAKRIKLWKSFNLPLKEMEDRFIELIIARNNYFLRKKQTTLLEFYKGHFGIPEKSFQNFVKNKEEIIEYCNRLLPKMDKLPNWFYSKLNLPCYLCQLAEFPFKDFAQVIDFVFQRYPRFAVFKSKVKIKMGEATRIQYRKETDSFLITIDKYANLRHQLVGLIHELSHTISFLKNFRNNQDPLERGKYFAEIEAIAIEFSLLKEAAEELFRASLSEVLLTFWRVLFEMELYKNPNQNIGKLFAHTFNLCFKGASQKRNEFYLLNERVLTAPFSGLPHAVAYSELLRKRISSELKSQ